VRKGLKALLVLVLALGAVSNLTACRSKEKNVEAGDKLRIVVTNFPCYDFMRAVVKDSAELQMLLKPGAEEHAYEPAAQDILDIRNCDVFVFIGGESDSGFKRILSDLSDNKPRIVRLIDQVVLKAEVGFNYDEHIWTSPQNAIRLVETLRDVIMEVDPERSAFYQDNAEEYIGKLRGISEEIRKIVDEGDRRLLVFGDRFPFLYFVTEYGLDYYAAFPGCAKESEASAGKITDLIKVVKEGDVPVVFYLEFSNQNIAKTIAEATGAKTRLFHSAHNVSQKDFAEGKTYVEIMWENIKNLGEALH